MEPYRIKDMLAMMLEEPEQEYSASLTPTIAPITSSEMLTGIVDSENSFSFISIEDYNNNNNNNNKLEQPSAAIHFADLKTTPNHLQSPLLQHQQPYSQPTLLQISEHCDDSFINQVLVSDDISQPTSEPQGTTNNLRHAQHHPVDMQKFYATEEVSSGKVSTAHQDHQQLFQHNETAHTQQQQLNEMLNYKMKEPYSDTESVEAGFGMMSVNSATVPPRYADIIAEESSPKEVRSSVPLEAEPPRIRKKSICEEGIKIEDDSIVRKRRKSVPTVVTIKPSVSPPTSVVLAPYDEKRKFTALKSSAEARRNRRASVPAVIHKEHSYFHPDLKPFAQSGALSAGEEMESSPPSSPSDMGDKEEEETEEIRMPQIKVTRSGKRRLKWTAELSELFTKAVEKLGPGAVPSAILDEMGVQGLTRGNISSHLQKYRLEMRQMQLQKQAEEEHHHFNHFHFNHPESFLDSQGKRIAKLQFPPIAAPTTSGYHYSYDPLMHAAAGEIYNNHEEVNSYMGASAMTDNRCPPSTGSEQYSSPSHMPAAQPPSPQYHTHFAIPPWEGRSGGYPNPPPAGASYPMTYPYSTYCCTCSCSSSSSTSSPVDPATSSDI